MSSSVKIESMVKSYLAELPFLAFKNYGEKRVTINFFSDINVFDVMVFTSEKKAVFHVSHNVTKAGAFESLLEVVEYLKSIEVKK